MANAVVLLQNGQTLTTGANEVVVVQFAQGQTLAVTSTDPTLVTLSYSYGGPVSVDSGIEAWTPWPGNNPSVALPTTLTWVAPGFVYVQVTAGGYAVTLTARASTPDDLSANWAPSSVVTVDVGNTAITLTAEQLKAPVLYLTNAGSHAGRTNITFPQRVGLYCIDSTTYGSGTGGGNIALITANAGNTPLNVDAGTAGWFWCNGESLFFLQATTAAFTAVTATDITTVNLVATGNCALGDAASDTIGAYGVTKVAQPSAFTQTYSTTSKTIAAPTAATLTDSTGGTPGATLAAITSLTVYATDAAAIRNALASLAAQVNALTADTLAMKKNDNAIIDDLQAEGWLA